MNFYGHGRWCVLLFFYVNVYRSKSQHLRTQHTKITNFTIILYEPNQEERLTHLFPNTSEIKTRNYTDSYGYMIHI